jgi:hypothetical protein
LAMSNLAEIFLNLDDGQRRNAQIELCQNALNIWENYIAQFEQIEYDEWICGTHQIVDKSLPKEAFEAVIRGRDERKIDSRYAEPMHDEFLEFPDNIEFAYYAIYNLFNKYIQKLKIDDWLICNQALSAETDSEQWEDLLNDAILKSL